MSVHCRLPTKEALLDGVTETVIAEITAAADHVDTEVDSEDGRRVRLRQRFLAAASGHAASSVAPWPTWSRMAVSRSVAVSPKVSAVSVASMWNGAYHW